MRRAAYKSWTITSALAVFVLSGMGFRCTSMKSEVLEFENVVQYKLDVDPATKVPARISGLSFRSSHCVRGVGTRTNGGVLIVLVEIGPCEKGQSGNFSYPLNISEGISELRFGTKEHMLWKREDGGQ